MKRMILLALMVCAIVFAAAPAWAAVSLSLTPSNQKIPVGGTASVDLVVAGLGNFAPDSLGAFSVDIAYNTSILSITDLDVTFGSFLGDTTLFEASSFASVAGGVVHLDETSFLFPEQLDVLQPGSFVLGTLAFTGISAGLSSLDFLAADLSDGFGMSFSNITTTGANVAPVPLPATLLLLGSGIAGLAGLRRKFAKTGV